MSDEEVKEDGEVLREKRARIESTRKVESDAQGLSFSRDEAVEAVQVPIVLSDRVAKVACIGGFSWDDLRSISHHQPGFGSVAAPECQTLAKGATAEQVGALIQHAANNVMALQLHGEIMTAQCWAKRQPNHFWTRIWILLLVLFPKCFAQAIALQLLHG